MKLLVRSTSGWANTLLGERFLGKSEIWRWWLHTRRNYILYFGHHHHGKLRDGALLDPCDCVSQSGGANMGKQMYTEVCYKSNDNALDRDPLLA